MSPLSSVQPKLAPYVSPLALPRDEQLARAQALIDEHIEKQPHVIAAQATQTSAMTTFTNLRGAALFSAAIVGASTLVEGCATIVSGHLSLTALLLPATFALAGSMFAIAARYAMPWRDAATERVSQARADIRAKFDLEREAARFA